MLRGAPKKLSTEFAKVNGDILLQLIYVSPTSAELYISQGDSRAFDISNKDLNEIRNVQHLDLQITWETKSMKTGDLDFLKNLLNSLHINRISLQLINLTKANWDKLFSLVISNVCDMREVKIEEQTPKLSASIFFQCMTKHKNISGFSLKNVVSKNMHYQFLEYFKSNSENLQKLTLNMNLATFYVLKYAANLNSFPHLTSLKFDFVPESNRIFIPLLCALRKKRFS
eukprot:snap_masked-scaffold_81-processed-gene-0.0-mRNA-1 protein AED:1.00 eAED:1.00 QI:0/-1/0/0/-1/1/1/0/227